MQAEVRQGLGCLLETLTFPFELKNSCSFFHLTS